LKLLVLARAATDLTMSWVSYRPGYRTPALTGTGLGFPTGNLLRPPGSCRPVALSKRNCARQSDRWRCRQHAPTKGRL